jgi:hypothetical protein
MATTVKAVQTGKEMNANAAKRSSTKAKRLYKEAMLDGSFEDLAYDKDGNLLTNAMFFNGIARMHAGMTKKVRRKKADMTMLTAKYEGLASIKHLTAEATNWNAVVYKTASEQLYKLLADVYVVVQGLYAVESDEKALRRDMKDYAAQLNVTVKSTTSVVGVLVNCVFKNVPRQRRCAYSIGLQNLIAAIGLDTDAEDVAAAIEAAGGIYELAKPYKDEAKDSKLKDSKQYLLNTVKAAKVCTTSDKQLAALLIKQDVQYVLVATRNANGKVVINNAMDDEALVLAVARKANKQKANTATEGVTTEVGFTGTTVVDEVFA